ncbi:hypothetical protein EDD18DRAFT_1080569 [Armillaria luteobubalina]|uniref:F-box domain-containing protein n=1 Tax=Armillaria luteobubalina TaxID=153913 RepID=A0AA39UHX6_9AGAR|nr:hypothetical protein EDD18DRAFT_1080569 [Armillaria luteobubalina]
MSFEQQPKSLRRRSLNILLQVPILSRSHAPSTISAPQAIATLPADIILEIANLLWRDDLLNLSLTSSYLRALLMTVLYDTVVLTSSRTCRKTLRMLQHRPEICRYIHKLAVRPNYYLAWPRSDERIDENWVASAVESIAQSLTTMHTFDWDGLEMPKDSLWQTLRLSCPQLRTVYSNVGHLPLDPESELFSFRNLKSFSLTVRHGLGGSELFPPMEALPERMWDMLLNHTPDLEELSLCSFSTSARLFDVTPVTTGNWPKLATLTLGSFGYQDDFTLSPPNDIPFGNFLSNHSTLNYIRFAWNFKQWLSPDNVSTYLGSDALPKLSTYIGIYQQLAELPHPESITSLDLTCEPLYDSRMPMICPILRTLTSLTSLDIWMHIPDDAPSSDCEFIRPILLSCPKLTEFHFMCTTAFRVRHLSAMLGLLPALKTFSVTKGHRYGEREKMRDTAVGVVRHNPGLSQVNVRWARERCRNHLKQEGTYDVIKGNDGGQVERLGVYERGVTAWGAIFKRRYVYEVKEPRSVGFGSIVQAVSRR